MKSTYKTSGSYEIKIINKFSKFLLEFSGAEEFKNYVKKNKFKIYGYVEYGHHKFFHHRPLDYEKIERSMYKKWRLPPTEKKFTSYVYKIRKIKFHTIKVLPHLFGYAVYLVKEDKTIGLFPLNKFIGILNGSGYNLDDLYNDMEKDGRFFIYWIKDFMIYDDKKQEIETIIIQRRYLGTLKEEKVEESGDESRLVVLGIDSVKRTINREAKKYFEDKGHKVEFTQKLSYDEGYPNGTIINLLENEEAAKALKKEDFSKIRKRIHQSGLAGFPDLFVWDDNGYYFFVEVKSENDKLHLSQYNWIKWNKNIGKFDFKIMRIMPK